MVSPAADPAPPDELHAEVCLREAHYVEAWTTFAESKGHIRGLRVVAGLVLAVGVGGMLASGFPPLPGLWSVLVVLGLAGFYLARAQWTWVARRAFAQLPAARHRYEVTIGPDGVHAKGPRAEVQYVWSTLAGWLETPQAFALLGRFGVADLVPKESLTAEQAEGLRRLLDRHVAVPEPVTDPAAAKKQSWRVFALWVLLIVAFIAIYELITKS